MATTKFSGPVNSVNGFQVNGVAMSTTFNGTDIVAGASGTAGSLKVFPATASRGDFKITSSNQTGNTEVTLNADAMGQATTIHVPDPGVASAYVGEHLSSSSAVASHMIVKVITATAAALATAGKVNVMVHPSATSQFGVYSMRVIKSTGLSGGGGDRLLALTDGTIVFNGTGVTAAVLGTPVTTRPAGTGNPDCDTAVDPTASTAGADIYLQYTGGTTDFTTGSVKLEVVLYQVTA